VSKDEDKTEKPTPKRMSEARKEGQIAKSPELVSWIAVFLGISVVKSTAVKGGRFLKDLMDQMGVLIADPEQAQALAFMTNSITGAFKIIAPLTITFAVIGIIGHLAQVRFVLAMKAVKPSFKKLNPIKGAKQLLSPQSLFMAAKQLIKSVVLGYVAYRTLWDTVINLSSNGPYSVGALISITSVAVMEFIKQVAIAGVIIGVIDYLYQRRKIGKQLKMSKNELKQESKQQESSPEVRGRMRQKQRAMSRNRMMAAIPDADVVVVNPVHVAIALSYDSEKGAPRVVAKGAGFVADKIREKADEHNILLVQDVPLARTLHRLCDVDDEIPVEIFESVARLLAFVFALRSNGKGLGLHKMPGTPEVDEYERQEALEADKAAAEAAKASVGANVGGVGETRTGPARTPGGAEQRFGTRADTSSADRA